MLSAAFGAGGVRAGKAFMAGQRAISSELQGNAKLIQAQIDDVVKNKGQ